MAYPKHCQQHLEDLKWLAQCLWNIDKGRFCIASCSHDQPWFEGKKGREDLEPWLDIDWFVAPIYADITRGSTSGSCGSFSGPCSQIQDAIAKCPTGGVVYIAPGICRTILHAYYTNLYFSQHQLWLIRMHMCPLVSTTMSKRPFHFWNLLDMWSIYQGDLNVSIDEMNALFSLFNSCIAFRWNAIFWQTIFRLNDTTWIAGFYSGTGNIDISFQGKGIVVSSYLGSSYTAIAPNGAGRGFIFNNNEVFSSVLNGEQTLFGKFWIICLFKTYFLIARPSSTMSSLKVADWSMHMPAFASFTMGQWFFKFDMLLPINSYSPFMLWLFKLCFSPAPYCPQ